MTKRNKGNAHGTLSLTYIKRIIHFLEYSKEPKNLRQIKIFLGCKINPIKDALNFLVKYDILEKSQTPTIFYSIKWRKRK